MQEEIQEKTKCLAPGLTHAYEYQICEFGYSRWKCTLCRDVQDQLEDANL